MCRCALRTFTGTDRKSGRRVGARLRCTPISAGGQEKRLQHFRQCQPPRPPFLTLYVVVQRTRTRLALRQEGNPFYICLVEPAVASAANLTPTTKYRDESEKYLRCNDPKVPLIFCFLCVRQKPAQLFPMAAIVHRAPARANVTEPSGAANNQRLRK